MVRKDGQQAVEAWDVEAVSWTWKHWSITAVTWGYAYETVNYSSMRMAEEKFREMSRDDRVCWLQLSRTASGWRSPIGMFLPSERVVGEWSKAMSDVDAEEHRTGFVAHTKECYLLDRAKALEVGDVIVEGGRASDASGVREAFAAGPATERVTRLARALQCDERRLESVLPEKTQRWAEWLGTICNETYAGDRAGFEGLVWRWLGEEALRHGGGEFGRPWALGISWERERAPEALDAWARGLTGTVGSQVDEWAGGEMYDAWTMRDVFCDQIRRMAYTVQVAALHGARERGDTEYAELVAWAEQQEATWGPRREDCEEAWVVGSYQFAELLGDVSASAMECDLARAVEARWLADVVADVVGDVFVHAVDTARAMAHAGETMGYKAVAERKAAERLERVLDGEVLYGCWDMSECEELVDQLDEAREQVGAADLALGLPGATQRADLSGELHAVLVRRYCRDETAQRAAELIEEAWCDLGEPMRRDVDRLLTRIERCCGACLRLDATAASPVANAWCERDAEGVVRWFPTGAARSREAVMVRLAEFGALGATWVVRSFLDRVDERSGWPLREVRALRYVVEEGGMSVELLDAAETFDFCLTDFETGEALAPEPGVRYLGWDEGSQ